MLTFGRKPTQYCKGIILQLKINKFLKMEWDFPGGLVVKNLPSDAGDTGSIPGRGSKIPQAVFHDQNKK